MWLEAGHGRRKRTRKGVWTQREATRNKDEGRGTPQGAWRRRCWRICIWRRFLVLGWKTGGHAERLDAHIVNYADDFVICCRPGDAAEGDDGDATDDGEVASDGETRRRRVNVCCLRKPLRSCGFNVRSTSVLENGSAVFDAPTPTASLKKKVSWGSVKRSARKRVAARRGERVEDQVRRLNQILMGWGQLLPPRLCHGSLAGGAATYACRRLRWWLRRKHGGKGSRQGPPDLRLYEEYGLIPLPHGDTS